MTVTASTVEVARGYEALRAQAVGRAPATTPRGLALFQRAGLAAWMRACAPLGSAAAAAPPGGDRPRPPPVAVDAELVRILTEMALGGHRRSRA
jgi:hypothetical protein